MRDPGWNMRHLRVADENAYAIELPRIFYVGMLPLLKLNKRVKTFEVFVEPHFSFSQRSLNAAIREVENALKGIEVNFDKIFEWTIALQQNKRTAISGAEYWELVSLWSEIKSAVERSNKKVIAYPAFYESNLDELRRIFDTFYFDAKLDAVMQPLYKELKKCREDELALPKYQF